MALLSRKFQNEHCFKRLNESTDLALDEDFFRKVEYFEPPSHFVGINNFYKKKCLFVCIKILTDRHY
jgi:hypothetical protein